MSVVLFSGGCDSTLVLYDLAMQRLKNPQYYNLIALSITHDQVPALIQQQKAREKIKEEFIKRELSNYIQFIDIDIKQTGGGICHASGIMQPTIWITTASLYVATKDTIYLGYHKGDDYWMYKTEAELSLKNFCNIQDKREVSIEYPLSGMTKANIIRNLRDRGLYDLVWYCENPTSDDKPCGRCYPCEIHQTAVWQLDNLKSYTDPCVECIAPKDNVKQASDECVQDTVQPDPIQGN